MKKQCVINTLLFMGMFLAILFSLLKVTPFEVTSETYIGTIVTLLSLAATFVIGYQIYNAIEFKKEIENQKEKYNDIIKRNEEIKAKMIQQEFVMEEGFAIISSLIKYNSGQSFVVCGEAFQAMHNALVFSIETNRTDYEWIFNYLRLYIAEMNWQTFASGISCSSDKCWYINTPGKNYGKPLKEIIDEYIDPIKENDMKLRTNKNFCKIQLEYERIMKLFYKRVSDIIVDPMTQMSFEERKRIINSY